MKKYIVIIRLGEAVPSKERVMEAVPKIKAEIEGISKKDCQLAFTTPDGSTFGFLLKTSIPAGVIHARLCGDTTKDRRPSILRNEDSILVVEVGDDLAGMGFSRAWTWLQHR